MNKLSFVLERWAESPDIQYRILTYLFYGGQISAVGLDPSGSKFPREFYQYYLRYDLEKGLIPGAINENYLKRDGISNV